MVKKLLFLMISFAFICSCSRYKDINIEDIKLNSFNLVSASEVNAFFDVKVNNPTKATFTVTNIDGVIKKDGTPFANIDLLKDVIVPPGTPVDTKLSGKADLIDPMSVLVMGLNIKSWSLKDFTADVKIVVKKGKFKKTFRYKDVPLEKLAKKVNIGSY